MRVLQISRLNTRGCQHRRFLKRGMEVQGVTGEIECKEIQYTHDIFIIYYIYIILYILYIYIWLVVWNIFIYQILWVNYNISPTWIKAIWGWFPILTMISSEVAVRSLWFTHILYIYIYQLYHMEKSSKDGNRTGQISRTCGWSSILFCAPLTMIHRYDL